jgi:hypothetical protein
MNNAFPIGMAKMFAYQAQRPQIVVDGTQALDRLVRVAYGDSGQSRVIGTFLLGLYCSEDHPFELNELRRLDLSLFDDCQRVLAMDYQPEMEIHERVPHGAEIWARLATLWAPERMEK